MATSRFIKDSGLTARMTLTMFLLGALFVGLVSLVIGLLPQMFLRRLEEREVRELSSGATAGLPGSARPHQISRAPSSAGRFAGR